MLTWVRAEDYEVYGTRASQLWQRKRRREGREEEGREDEGELEGKGEREALLLASKLTMTSFSSSMRSAPLSSSS